MCVPRRSVSLSAILLLFIAAPLAFSQNSQMGDKVFSSSPASILVLSKQVKSDPESIVTVLK